MAFASVVTKRGVQGSIKVVYGTYTSDGGSTGGDIETGLNYVYHIQLQPISSAVVADQPAVNETLPLAGGDVTVVTTANETGTFKAEGK